jgi:large conductance mechanosensitive channel
MMLRDFKSFLTKNNTFALALGVIIGAAVGNVVSAINADLLMPIISLVLPSGDWRSAEIAIGRSMIHYGHLLGTLIDFAVVALVVYLFTKWLIKPSPGSPTRTCPECLETIPAAAKRCRACSSLSL